MYGECANKYHCTNIVRILLDATDTSVVVLVGTTSTTAPIFTFAINVR